MISNISTGIATTNNSGNDLFITTKKVRNNDKATDQIIMEVAIILKNLL